MKKVLRVMLASTVVSVAVYIDAPLKTINGWVHLAGTELESSDLLKSIPVHQ